MVANTCDELLEYRGDLAHIPEETWRCGRTASAKARERSERDRKFKPSVLWIIMENEKSQGRLTNRFGVHPALTVEATRTHAGALLISIFMWIKVKQVQSVD